MLKLLLRTLFISERGSFSKSMLQLLKAVSVGRQAPVISQDFAMRNERSLVMVHSDSSKGFYVASTLN